MHRLLDCLYVGVLLLASPYLFYRSWRTGRYRKHCREKLFGLPSPLNFDSQSVWFHGVSVGEIHLLRSIVAAFRMRFPGVRVVVSATTDTGLAEAVKAFPELTVIPYPFDFSWAVRRTLDAVNPRLVVLAESELWPNFLRAAERKCVPVVVVNGRLSPRSAKRYATLGRIARPMLLDRVTCFGMQTDAYADNLRQAGVPAARIETIGSVKYDGALAARDNPKAKELRGRLGFGDEDVLWVAGSTHAPEEEISLRIYHALKLEFPKLRLVLVPRSPDRFAAVAGLLGAAKLPYVRRSEGKSSGVSEVVLIDTLGELSAVWGFADIGFVGGSFDGHRGGQSMIEPAGCGVPTLFGPHTWNFRDTVERLVECGGGRRCMDEAELLATMREWLADPILRGAVGIAARRMVEEQQGATERTMDFLAPFVDPVPARAAA